MRDFQVTPQKALRRRQLVRKGEEAPAVALIIIKLHLCVSEMVCTLQEPEWPK